MRSLTNDSPKALRLRFVFGNEVRSSHVPPDATLRDVAEALDGLAVARYGSPVSIDLADLTFDLSAKVRKFPKGRRAR